MGAEGIEAFYKSIKDLKGKYTVTGGSYITLELANRECSLWQKIGIDACVVSVKKSSLNKVVLGKFSDEKRASHFAESIKNMPTGTLSVSEVALDWK
jgi:cell division protein FtsN